jgi:hypothetical protein
VTAQVKGEGMIHYMKVRRDFASTFPNLHDSAANLTARSGEQEV